MALSLAWWCCGSALGLTSGPCSEGSAVANLGCAMPETPWATQRSDATRRTTMVTDWCNWRVTVNGSQWSAVRNPHRDTNTLIGAFGGCGGYKDQGKDKGQACQTALHSTLLDLGQSTHSSGRGQPALTSAKACFARAPEPGASERANTPSRSTLVGQDEKPSDTTRL